MMGKRMWAAVIPANHRANQRTQAADKNDSAHSCSRMGIGIGFRSNRRAQSEADCGADQCVATAPIVHSGRLAVSRGMCVLGSTWRTPGELSKLHTLVGILRIASSVGVVRVLASSRGN